MPEEKSRVIRYQAHREEIAKMFDYSFTEVKPEEKEDVHPSLTSKTASEGPEPVDFTPTLTGTNSGTNGIKRTTINLSLDDMMKAQETYDSKAQQKAARKAYKEKSGRKSNLGLIIGVAVTGAILMGVILTVVLINL